METTQSPPSDDLLEEYKHRSKFEPWTVYPVTAVPAILPFHESKANIRILAGPNRGGKTTAGAFEIASFAMGFNPVRNEKYVVPNVTWAVCLTYKAQGKQMYRALSQMLPKRPDGTPAWRWWKQESLIVCDNGSEIYLKQQEDGREAFYGEGCTAIWVDEGKEGETGKENFNEILTREIPGQPLKVFVTLTPLNGCDWLWNRLWNEDSDDFIKGTEKFHFSMYDCAIEKGGFWSLEQINARAEKYEEYERQARLYGDFTPFGTARFFNAGKLMKALETAPKGVRVTPSPSASMGISMKEEEDGIAQLFREKNRERSYIAAWDPSSGVGGDNSAFVVLDRHDLAIVFQARNNHMDPKLYAESIVLPAANYYNGALLAIERTGSGAAAVQACIDYHNLYYDRAIDRRTANITDRIGWNTSEPTRIRVMDGLTRALREGKWLPTRELLEEMGNVVIKRTESGKMRPEHADGMHDDLVMAAGIALAVHYQEPIYDWPDFSKLRVRYGPSPSVQHLSFT